MTTPFYGNHSVGIVGRAPVVGSGGVVGGFVPTVGQAQVMAQPQVQQQMQQQPQMQQPQLVQPQAIDAQYAQAQFPQGPLAQGQAVVQQYPQLPQAQYPQLPEYPEYPAYQGPYEHQGDYAYDYLTDAMSYSGSGAPAPPINPVPAVAGPFLNEPVYTVGQRGRRFLGLPGTETPGGRVAWLFGTGVVLFMLGQAYGWFGRKRVDRRG